MTSYSIRLPVLLISLHIITSKARNIFPQGHIITSVHFEMYRNHYVGYRIRNTPSAVSQFYFQSKEKQTHRKGSQICGYQRWGLQEGKLDEGSQGYKLPVKA